MHDGDGGLEVVALLLPVVHLDGGALGRLPLQVRQLLPQHVAAVALAATVVGRVDLHARVARLLVRHDVTPALVVVHAQRHQEVVALGVGEAQHAGRAAAVHGQRVLAAALSPRAAVGIVPHGLLHDVVPLLGLGLDHPHLRVRHGPSGQRRGAESIWSEMQEEEQRMM